MTSLNTLSLSVAVVVLRVWIIATVTKEWRYDIVGSFHDKNSVVLLSSMILRKMPKTFYGANKAYFRTIFFL